MAVQATNTDRVTSLYAVTLEQYSPQLIDNIFDANAVLTEIKKSSKVASYDGGKSLVVPLLVEGSAGASSYSGYDAVNVAPAKGLIDAEITWSYYQAPVTVCKQEIDENAGKAKVVDIVESKIMQTENTVLDLISDHLWAASRGNGSKDLNPFPVMIEASATPGAYMGVTDTAWRNKYRSAAATDLAKLFGKIYRDLTDGTEKPNLIITSDAGEEMYEDFITGKNIDIGLRYTSNDKADIGYGRFSYKGIPILTDKHVTNYGSSESTPNFWFLNTKYLGFKFKNIEQTEWLPSATQPGAKSKFMLSTVQLFTNQRRRQGLARVTA